MEETITTPDGPGAFGCSSSGGHEELQRYIMQKLDIVGQLAGGISHNFNNQLTGIMGFANLIAMRAENEGIKKFAEEILGICKNAGEMVRELLAFARYKPVTAAVQNVNTIITAVTNLLGSSIDKRIEIVTDLSPSPCNVFADAVQLQSLLFNIALNSKDAMPTGGKLVFSTRRVEATVAGTDASEAPRGYVRIEIADTGHGFGDDVRERIFEPFFTTKAQGHPGLGLSAAYNLVSLMNGSIELNSEAGKGTSAIVMLPIHSDASTPVPAPTQTAGPAATKATPTADGAAPDAGGKKTYPTILLVDDDNCIRESLSAYLRSAGYSVFTATDGLDAVEKYGKTGGKSVDLVILDMVMPRMGGLDAFLKMKEINPSITAIGITGYTNHTQEELLAAGMKRMLHKPFEFEELSRVIAEYIHP
jgi:CheY-like chemotaxis protein/two-component sensor histidine kinase